MKDFILAFIFTVLFLNFSTPHNDQFIQKEYSQVDELLTEFLAKTNLPGLSISVNKSGTIIYSKGFGFADVQQKEKMKPTHQIRTASVAKVITATALGKLATDGKLDFDTPLKKYISYLEEPLANLTVRQIAGHTSGLPHQPDSKFKKKSYTTAKETLPFFEESSLLFEPDTQYEYSTLGYNLLALLIEEISGKTYTNYMKEDIFTPLGMIQTFPDDISTSSNEDAQLYFFKKDKLVLDKKAVNGSYKLAGAGFRSTSIDLAKMMNAYSNGFINENIVQSMFTSHKLRNEEFTNVGIAWRLNKDINDKPTIEHAGSWQGARTVIVHYPEDELSISIMINAKCTLFIEETAHILAQFFLNDSSPKSDISSINQALKITNNTSSGATESYKGQLTFSSDKIGRLRIETEKQWLQDNKVYPLLKDNNYVLSTEFGLLYLQIKQQTDLNGKLFLYQVINDKNHMNGVPLLSFTSDK